MARSQIIVVGGGINASPAFDATDESEGRGVYITSDDPATVGAGKFGQDASGGVWVMSGASDATIAASGQRAILLGRDLTGIDTAITSANDLEIVIGYSAALGALATECIVIGPNSEAEGNAIVIGRSLTISTGSGTDAPIVIGGIAPSNAGLTTVISIGAVTQVTITRGVVIAGSVTTGGGTNFNDALCILGRVENGPGICLGNSGGTNTNTNGASCIAIGDNAARAGGTVAGTAYDRCVAIGRAAVATGSGATGVRNSIAIGAGATATTTTTTALAIALGPATAADAECVIGAAASPATVVVWTSGAATGGVRVNANTNTDPAMRFNAFLTGAGAAVGTLNNAPAAGDPAFWLKVSIAGTDRYIPCW